MSVVWKFPLSNSASQTLLNMPEGAVVLHFGLQADVPTIWAGCNPDADPVTRSFQIFGTGHPIPDGAEYVGTFTAGPFVWHVFEVFA